MGLGRQITSGMVLIGAACSGRTKQVSEGVLPPARFDSLYSLLAGSRPDSTRQYIFQQISCERIRLSDAFGDSVAIAAEMHIVNRVRMPDGRPMRDALEGLMAGYWIGGDYHACPELWSSLDSATRAALGQAARDSARVRSAPPPR